MTSLIASSVGEYETIAIGLATSPEKLKGLQEELANNISSTPLFNTKLFAKHLETAYLKMQDKEQNGLEHENIYI